MISDMREALRFHLQHDDITHYNAVQKLLYAGYHHSRHRPGAVRVFHVEADAVSRS